MPFPTWVPGQVLNASDVTQWFIELVAVKSSTQAIANNTTLANDADLVVAVVSSAVYKIEANLIYDGGTGGSETDFKFRFTMPASATVAYGVLYFDAGGAAKDQAGTAADTLTISTGGVGVPKQLLFKALLTVAGTAGNFQLQWAQGISGGTNTRLYQGSYLTARRVG